MGVRGLGVWDMGFRGFGFCGFGVFRVLGLCPNYPTPGVEGRYMLGFQIRMGLKDSSVLELEG